MWREHWLPSDRHDDVVAESCHGVMTAWRCATLGCQHGVREGIMHPAAFKKKLRRDLKAQEREDLVWGNKLERGEEVRSISDLKVWSESESVMTAGRKKNK